RGIAAHQISAPARLQRLAVVEVPLGQERVARAVQIPDVTVLRLTRYPRVGSADCHRSAVLRREDVLVGEAHALITGFVASLRGFELIGRDASREGTPLGDPDSVSERYTGIAVADQSDRLATGIDHIREVTRQVHMLSLGEIAPERQAGARG